MVGSCYDDFANRTMRRNLICSGAESDATYESVGQLIVASLLSRPWVRRRAPLS
jgi:hypothetical protein